MREFTYLDGGPTCSTRTDYRPARGSSTRGKSTVSSQGRSPSLCRHSDGHRQDQHVEGMFPCSWEVQNLKVRTDVEINCFNSVKNRGQGEGYGPLKKAVVTSETPGSLLREGGIQGS